MKQIKFLIINIFLLSTFFSNAQQDQPNSITIKQFKEKLENDKEIIVLDVRTEQELTGPLGKIEKSINIPVQVLEQRLTELEPLKNKEMLVICRTQNRSALAVDILQKKGYKAKYVLGGMTAFKEE
jgi:rhodanese-related sulfurtransferase